MTRGLNEFYGNDAQLRAYHSRFLPALEPTPRELPVLDLGCGSGVFLELVREQGRTGRGVELAEPAIAQARAKGLEVAQDDALHFLESQLAASYSAVYCSHLIEHLDYAYACRLLDECCRVLAPQ